MALTFLIIQMYLSTLLSTATADKTVCSYIICSISLRKIMCVPLGFPFNFHCHFVSTGKRKREWGIELRNHTENEFSIRNTSYMLVFFSEAKVDRSSSTCATSTDAPSFTWNSVSLLRASRNLDSLCITSSSVTKPDRWKDSMLRITWFIKL